MATCTMTESTTPSMYEDVAKFHREILGVEFPLVITLKEREWILERFRFLNEEADEFLEAGLTSDLVKTVDGLLDIVYVALGTLYYMGVPVPECWNAVQKANMAKIRGMTKRGNVDDAVKPYGWVGPEQEIAAACLKVINKDLE